MLIHGYTPYIPLLILTLFPLMNAQLTTLPQCIQTCITQQSSCTLTSIYCLCQASNSFTSFLPDLMSCIHSSCSSNLDPNLLLTPLQLACQIDGEPIPASILSVAQNQGGGGGIVTATITMSGSGTGEGGGETTTITSLETHSSRISTTATPVVIITTNSAGSTYAHSVSDPGTSSGMKTTSVPLIIISGPSTSIDSTIRGGKTSTTTTPMSAVTETSSSSTLKSSKSIERSSKTSTSTSTSSGQKQTDSAPFTNTNSGALKLGCGNFWIWMGVLGGIGMIWIW